jgi:glycosyltransferase involved in cell wall biosynthesis
MFPVLHADAGGDFSKAMRILITEEALRLGNGHWPSYVQDLAEGFRAAGDHVDILAHKQAQPKVFEAVPGAIPWFSRDCRADPRSQGLIGGIRHNFSFARDLRAWLEQNGPYDWVLSLSSRPKHLMGFALLSKRNARREIAQTRFVVMFVLGFGRFAGAGKPAVFPKRPVTYFTKFCFWLVADAVRRGQVVLAAETKGMQAEVERFSGLPAVLFPHPVEMPAEPQEENAEKLKAGRPAADSGGLIADSEAASLTGTHDEGLEAGGSEDTEAPNLRPYSLDAPAKPVVVTAPGYARYEKGSDLLQGAIKILLKKMRDDMEVPRLRFVLQWQEEFVTPEGEMVSPNPELKASPDVEFLDGIRVGEAYLDVLRGADLIALPYRCRAYNRRVSRISVEAALMGKPIVYMRHTWSGEVAELAECGAEIPEETPEAIAEALLQAARNLPWLAEKARTGRNKVAEFYSVETFRKILLQLGREVDP